jgi:hypothetical protein
MLQGRLWESSSGFAGSESLAGTTGAYSARNQKLLGCGPRSAAEFLLVEAADLTYEALS